MARVTFDFGINETEATQETEALSGINFDLELAARRLFPRRPIDIKGTLPNGGSVNGLLQLIKRDNTETTLVYSGGENAATPALYEWTGANTSTAFTSVRTTNCFSTSMLRDTYWSLDDYLVITDIRKLTPLLNWDGTSATRHKTNLGAGTTTANTDITEAPAGTYTVLSAAHGLVLGDLAIIAGSDNTDLNEPHEVTNVPSAGAWVFEEADGLGGTTSTHGTTEKSVDVFAKYSAVYNNRLWLFNVTTDTDDNEHVILASAFEDAESFDTVNRNGVATGNAAFFTVTPDLKPINGVVSFNRQLIISTTDGALHRLSGIDASDYQFTTYYAGSASVGEESMVNLGNDVAYMLKGGGIDLLGATDTSGDVRADDLSRWIPTTTKDLTGSLSVYDQQNQKVLFILDTKILVLFKDILSTGGGSPWTVYQTALTDSDGNSIFTTKAAKYMRRPGQSTQTVYFGDFDGNIYDLNGSGTGDNGTDYEVTRKSPLRETTRQNIVRGHVQYRRLGEFNISLIFDWSNEYNQTQSDITLKGPPSTEGVPAYYNLDSYYQGTGTREEDYYNEGFAFSSKVSKQNFSPAGRADGYFMTFTTETTVQFQIDHIEILE
jgi:hypothetical protein